MDYNLILTTEEKTAVLKDLLLLQRERAQGLMNQFRDKENASGGIGTGLPEDFYAEHLEAKNFWARKKLQAMELYCEAMAGVIDRIENLKRNAEKEESELIAEQRERARRKPELSEE